MIHKKHHLIFLNEDDLSEHDEPLMMCVQLKLSIQ